MSVKSLKFLGSTLEDLRRFPDPPRRAAGFNLRHIQNGPEPVDWKSKPQIGRGVKEVRIHLAGE